MLQLVNIDAEIQSVAISTPKQLFPVFLPIYLIRENSSNKIVSTQKILNQVLERFRP